MTELPEDGGVMSSVSSVTAPNASAATDGEAAGDARAWPEPMPLDPPVPSFPVHAFPPPLRDWTTALAKSTQVPPDLVALQSLAVFSLAAAKKFLVVVRPGWTEPVNLYTATVAESGTRKSPVHRAIVAPLKDAERTLQASTLADRMALEQRRRLAEANLKKAERLAVKRGPADPDAAAAAASALQVVRELPEPMPTPRLWADDVTPEALAKLLAEHGGRLGVISDEGGVLGNLTGRYRRQPNLDVVLKGWDGTDFPVDRIGRGPLAVCAPVVVFGLAVQPNVLAGVSVEHPEVKERGLLARFLFARPDLHEGSLRVGYRKINPPPVPEPIRENYHALVYGLAVRPLPDSPQHLSLSTEAADAFTGWQEECELRRRPDGDLAAIPEWAGKVDGHTLRIAALLHLAESSDSPGISLPAMQGAIAIMSYCIPHAVAVDALAGGRRGTGDAHALLHWIKRTGRAEFSERDAQRGLHHRFHTADEARSAIKVLMDHGWVRPVRTERGPRNTGRSSSPRYVVHPLCAVTELTEQRAPAGQEAADPAGPSRSKE